MKAKKILALLVALVLLLPCVLLVSCGKEDDEGAEIGGEAILNTQEVDTSKILDLEKKSFNGHEFRIQARKSSHYHLDSHEILAETLTGDKLNDAVFTRNSQIEKEYDCKIIGEKMSSPANSSREPLMAGEYVADLLFDESRLLPSLATRGLLVNFNDLENVNLEKAWYDQNCINGINIGTKVFFMTGDAGLMDEIACFICRFNMDYLAEYDDSIDLYAEVKAGKWTIDRMYELVVATAKDLNGDGILVGHEDRFGMHAERATNQGFVGGCGVTMCEWDASGNISLPLTPKAELLDAWTALKPLLTTPARFHDDDGFYEGECVFFCHNAGSLINTSSTNYTLGVLPMPKQNEEQDKYYTTVYFSQLCTYSIPTTVNNAEDAVANGFANGVEQVAYFFEVFSYYSMNILTPAFTDQVLMKQSVRDPGSAEMIPIALENKLYDPVVGYGFGGMYIYKDLGSGPVGNVPGTDVNYDNFVSTYEARVSAGRKALQDYLNFVDFELNAAT